MDIHPNRASRLAPVASAVVTGLMTGSLVAVWRGAADGPAWSMPLAAGLLALTAVLALAWLSRTRAARRLRAAVDDFAEREIARERRRNAAEAGPRSS